MILRNNLYNLLSASVEEKQCRIALLPDSVIYRAHFPGQPITPGVCIIQMATELLEELLHTRLELSVVSNAKFLSVIQPEQTPEVVYRFQKMVEDEAGNLKVSVCVSRDEQTFTKLSLVYRKR